MRSPAHPQRQGGLAASHRGGWWSLGSCAGQLQAVRLRLLVEAFAAAPAHAAAAVRAGAVQRLRPRSPARAWTVATPLPSQASPLRCLHSLTLCHCVRVPLLLLLLLLLHWLVQCRGRRCWCHLPGPAPRPIRGMTGAGTGWGAECAYQWAVCTDPQIGCQR